MTCAMLGKMGGSLHVLASLRRRLLTRNQQPPDLSNQHRVHHLVPTCSRTMILILDDLEGLLALTVSRVLRGSLEVLGLHPGASGAAKLSVGILRVGRLGTAPEPARLLSLAKSAGREYAIASGTERGDTKRFETRSPPHRSNVAGHLYLTAVWPDTKEDSMFPSECMFL